MPLQDYLEVYPDKKDKLKKYITEGRIGVGPWFCLPDEFTVGVNDGVPPEHWLDVPPQYHLRWESEAAAEHDISVLYIIKNNPGK